MFGFAYQMFGFSLSNVRFRLSNVRFRLSNVRFRLSNVRFRACKVLTFSELRALQIEQIIQIHKSCVEKKKWHLGWLPRVTELPQEEY
jgi:hypothetical protein